MVEIGKRSRPTKDWDSNGRNHHRKRANVNESPDTDELVIYRILCPDSVLGSVIGKGGKVINSIRNESHAKIKVVDPFPGANKRVITIYCHVKGRDSNSIDEDNMKPLCPAQDALVKVHSVIVNALVVSNDSEKMDREEVHLLVPASQSANIIGKSGSTIKRLRSKTRANIKVTPKDSSDVTHSCAMSFDNFVSISGHREAVKRALFAISSIMYKFLAKEEISLDTTFQEFPHSNTIPSDISVYPANSFYPTSDSVMQSLGSLAPMISSTTQIPELHNYSGSGGAWPFYPSSVPVISGLGGALRSEEVTIRVLCPSNKIGSIIGKGGSTIKSIRHSSGAHVEVDDTKNESQECVVTVTSNESTHDLKSACVEAVLLLQGKINEENDKSVSMRLLVPSKVIGFIIGKSGAIINDIRKKTKADIRISKGEKPKFASSSDELIEVFGEVNNLRDAIVQIILRLREDALKDRSGNQNAPSADTSRTSSIPFSSSFPTIPQVGHFGYDQRLESGGLLSSMPSAANLYGFSTLQVGDNEYGSISSFSSKMFGGPFVEMVIPANAVGKVMGKGGGNIDTIRKISGAQIEIVDSKSSRSERMAQISGTPEQKRTAENLIQAFIMST